MAVVTFTWPWPDGVQSDPGTRLLGAICDLAAVNAVDLDPALAHGRGPITAAVPDADSRTSQLTVEVDDG